jgi:hypothetical protein
MAVRIYVRALAVERLARTFKLLFEARGTPTFK